jgi:hypothetical protein
MKLKSLAAGALLAVASFSAFAGDQTISAVADGATHGFFADWTQSSILSGGEDVITFALNPGMYKISVSVTGQQLTFDAVNSNLNGVLGTTSDVATPFGTLKFFGVGATGSSPFVLKLDGLAGPGAFYTGTYTVTAVPEPETYGMMLGGLALVGAIAARRKAKKAA